jgi:diamine N-acetyltransferase
MDEQIGLRLVGRHNVLAVCALKLAEGQERYVAPAAVTIAEAAYEPSGWLRAIYLGETPVGVVLVEREDACRPLLVRLMIAASHQRRGVGRQVVRMVAEHFAGAGATELLTSYVRAAGARRLLPDVWLRGDRPRARPGAGHEP